MIRNIIHAMPATNFWRFWAFYLLLMLCGTLSYLAGIRNGTWLELVSILKENPTSIALLTAFAILFTKFSGLKYIDGAIVYVSCGIVVLSGAVITKYFIL